MQLSHLNWPDEMLETVHTAQRAARNVSLFTSVIEHPLVEALLELLSLQVEGQRQAESAWYRFLGLLAADAQTRDGLPIGEPPLLLSAWQSFLIDGILQDENPFTLQAERSAETVPPGVLALAAHDLRCLQILFNLPDHLAPYIDPDGLLPGLAPPPPLAGSQPPMVAQMRGILSRFANAHDWGDCVTHLATYISKVGAGDFGRYVAFRWDERAVASEDVRVENDPGGRSFGRLLPIQAPSLVNLGHLIDYEAEREVVLRNTEKLMQGLPAQNVLLYGDRGTGKSATVKAMLHTFAPSGLRMIEIPRSALADIPHVLSAVRARPHPLILFIDDLSFEEGDIAYKELKAVLEGTLEGRPRNVLVYATSNRRHLIQEQFADRRRSVGDDGEVNPQDSLQEKLSLADRFGITVIFPSPDQERYLNIVSGVAKQRGLDIPEDSLRRRALQWAAWHNGRSARTAQQFIDHLVGEDA